jgi:hypothetical protein
MTESRAVVLPVAAAAIGPAAHAECGACGWEAKRERWSAAERVAVAHIEQTGHDSVTVRQQCPAALYAARVSKRDDPHGPPDAGGRPVTNPEDSDRAA